MKRIILLLIISSLGNLSNGQDTIIKNKYPQLTLDFPLLDLPYQNYAAKTVSSDPACPNCTATIGNYIHGYVNPSMKQSLNITADFYSTGHWGIKKVFGATAKDSGRTRLMKALGYTAAMTLFDFFSIYAPLGDGWLHEEFHRAVMTRRYVNSYNDMNKFPVGAETVSVSHITDNNLIRMKAESNADFVRMQEAGIEGEYMLVDKLQRNNFFYRQKLPHEALYWIATLNSILYVRMCSTSESVKETVKSNNVEGSNVKIRDFTGLDFDGWAYDLEHPEEPYQNRGIHPSGVGINRYRTSNDLSQEQWRFLKNQGRLQWLNIISPMMLGIRSILLKKDLQGNEWRGNIAMRHFLTSFGYDLSTHVYYQTPKHNFLFTLHNYHNFQHWFPGVEAGIVGYSLKIKRKTIPVDSRIMLWAQPDKQGFKTSKSQMGGLLSFCGYLPLGNWQPYIELEGKTAGWVAGNVFLNSNLSVRGGLRINIM